VGRKQAGIHQFCGRNRLDDGFTPTPAENKQDIPVLIRGMIGHEKSPAWYSQDTVDVSRCLLGHSLLDLFLNLKDPTG
jgi:hypothetical protein